MSKMEYTKKKKIRAAIYCRVGNPTDARIAVEHTFGHDDSRETAAIAGQNPYTEMETGDTGWGKGIVTGAGA